MAVARRLLVVVLALVTALTVLAGPARAAAIEPAVVAVTAPAGYAGEVTTVTVTVTAQDAPVVGGQVLVERSRDGAGVPVADALTDASGRVTARSVSTETPSKSRSNFDQVVTQ